MRPLRYVDVSEIVAMPFTAPHPRRDDNAVGRHTHSAASRTSPHSLEHSRESRVRRHQILRFIDAAGVCRVIPVAPQGAVGLENAAQACRPRAGPNASGGKAIGIVEAELLVVGRHENHRPLKKADVLPHAPLFLLLEGLHDAAVREKQNAAPAPSLANDVFEPLHSRRPLHFPERLAHPRPKVPAVKAEPAPRPLRWRVRPPPARKRLRIRGELKAHSRNSSGGKGLGCSILSPPDSIQ